LRGGGYCEATNSVDVGDVEVDVLAGEVAEGGLGEVSGMGRQCFGVGSILMCEGNIDSFTRKQCLE
jgi:hypothetical protein